MSRQFSQELKINAELTSRLRLLTGLYYFNERTHAQDNQYVRANAAAAQISYRRNFTLETNSYAAFGQLEYALTDTVKLTAAGRYTRDRKTLDYRSVSTNPVALFSFTDESIDALGTNFDPKRSFGKFTPKLGVSWQASADAFFYASWTKGFRSGGWTGRALRADQFRNFNPETVSSYEIGNKLSLFGRSVRLNNSAFYMDYSNLFNTLTSNGLFVVQLADARIYGLESEATIRASSWLDLFANGGYLHTAYRNPRPANLQTRLQRSPRFQGKTGFAIHYPLGEGTFLVDGDLFYSSAYFVTPANLAFTAPAVPVTSNRTSSYALVNGSVGYEFGDAGRYRVTLSCTNCFDKEFFDSGTIIGQYAAVFATTPRLYKIAASVKF